MKNLVNADYYLVIDVEATCDDKNSIPREETEIIEIGAVLVSNTDLQPTGELQTFVRPVRHPELTPFCKKLTSIEQSDVDGAPLFPKAIELLRNFIAERNVLFCSWGAYDRGQFQQDARYHRVDLPFRGRHLNLKEGFSEARRDKRRYGMSSALRKVGLPLVGTHHRGIDDARNIARLLPWVLGRAPALPSAKHA